MNRQANPLIASLAGLLLSCQFVLAPRAEVENVLEQPAVAKSAPHIADSTTEHKIVGELQKRETSLTGAELAILARTILDESERHHFEPELIMAIIFVESSGRPTAVSPVGARGLMQIMPPTGAELATRLGVPWEGPDTLFDPVINVKLGVAYLRTLTNRYADTSTALAAYNWGPGRIDRLLRRGAGLPTDYIDRVIKAYGERTSSPTSRS